MSAGQEKGTGVWRDDLWLLACEAGTALNLAEPFEENLRENVKGLALETLLGCSLVDFMKVQAKNYVWHGAANHLHDEMRPYWDNACGGSQKEMAKYPGNARVLSGRLTEMMASLRENGIVIEKDRTAAGRAISIDAREHFCRPATLGPDVTRCKGRRFDNGRTSRWDQFDCGSCPLSLPTNRTQIPRFTEYSLTTVDAQKGRGSSQRER